MLFSAAVSFNEKLLCRLFFCNILCFVFEIIIFVLTIEDEHVFVTDVSIRIIIIVLKIIISTVFVINVRKKLFLLFKNFKKISRTNYKP
jgi:hypothetical protein